MKFYVRSFIMEKMNMYVLKKNLVIMNKKTENQNQVYRKNIKKIRTQHLTDTEINNLGGTKGKRKHLYKLGKSANNKDYYT